MVCKWFGIQHTNWIVALHYFVYWQEIPLLFIFKYFYNPYLFLLQILPKIYLSSLFDLICPENIFSTSNDILYIVLKIRLRKIVPTLLGKLFLFSYMAKNKTCNSDSYKWICSFYRRKINECISFLCNSLHNYTRVILTFLTVLSCKIDHLLQQIFCCCKILITLSFFFFFFFPLFISYHISMMKFSIYVLFFSDNATLMENKITTSWITMLILTCI